MDVAVEVCITSVVPGFIVTASFPLSVMSLCINPPFLCVILRNCTVFTSGTVFLYFFFAKCDHLANVVD